MATKKAAPKKAAAKPKLEPVTTTVDAAVAEAFGTIEELAEEMREAYDNTPESLQGGGVGAARGEAADALESIAQPDLPECAQDLPVAYALRPLPRRASRSARLAHGLAPAYAAAEAIEEAIGEAPEGGPLHGELEEARDSIQEMIDEAEAVEFPGMYG